MPPKQAPEQGTQDLQFVVTTQQNPQNGTSAANRRKVRSQAALKSWPGRRNRNFEQLEVSVNRSGTSRGSQNPRPRAPQESSQKAQSSRRRDAGLSSSEAGPQPADKLLQSHNDVSDSQPEILLPHTSINAGLITPYTRPTPPGHQDYFPAQRQPIIVPPPATLQRQKRTADGTPKPHPFSPFLSPPPSPLSSSSINTSDPFNTSPVPPKPGFARILHHMMTVFAPRGWQSLHITTDQGRMWERFMTQHALAEPALFYVRLLFASGDMIRLGILPRETSYWLRGRAITAINEALRDPERAASDGLILAVGRIGFHEAMYGDRAASDRVHRPAQQRMIQMRGGMRALGFPELVKRLMRLTDEIMARRGGTERFIEDDEERPNWSLEEGVEVLEKWVPREGQALRKSIRIADIVND
ncbi:hypothetical protein LTR62_004727 [Meristemomyces frigidus]|uniref:Uncharacterized protein n=1 Tax=Meristemomyces frigidus TaxID=1508187 RepID=A0AAN7TQH2_9PEZI|nr:hypothetical protein LTR62_004727 [Meristemomyces frigidus]